MSKPLVELHSESLDVPLMRQEVDKAGVRHELMSADNRTWTSCRQHSDELGSALAGLPGAKWSCCTGRGWPFGVNLKIGWPIWLANLVAAELLQAEEVPVDVLRHLLSEADWDLAKLVLAHPKMTNALFALALTQFPQDREIIAAYRDHRSARLLDEGVEVEALNLELLTAVDLGEVPRVVLERILGNPEVMEEAYGLASNPTCPLWVMERLVVEGSRDWTFLYGLADNPSANSWVLAKIISSKHVSSDLLSIVAKHPLASFGNLSQLSQSHLRGVARIAGLRLAEMADLEQPAVESEGATVSW